MMIYIIKRRQNVHDVCMYAWLIREKKGKLQCKSLLSQDSITLDNLMED